MSKPIRVADYIAKTVERQGTDAIFMLIGGMMMHLMDAFGRIPSIRYYCHHHEQACAMSTEGYARNDWQHRRHQRHPRPGRHQRANPRRTNRRTLFPFGAAGAIRAGVQRNDWLA
jgi:hypothetical protein